MYLLNESKKSTMRWKAILAHLLYSDVSKMYSLCKFCKRILHYLVSFCIKKIYLSVSPITKKLRGSEKVYAWKFKKDNFDIIRYADRTTTFSDVKNHLDASFFTVQYSTVQYSTVSFFRIIFGITFCSKVAYEIKNFLNRIVSIGESSTIKVWRSELVPHKGTWTWCHTEHGPHYLQKSYLWQKSYLINGKHYTYCTVKFYSCS